jgi:hypothetical protein
MLVLPTPCNTLLVDELLIIYMVVNFKLPIRPVPSPELIMEFILREQIPQDVAECNL